MMRYGRLLAEDAPAALIETYKQSSLENVFLSLCMSSGDQEAADTCTQEPGEEMEAVITRAEGDTKDATAITPLNNSSSSEPGQSRSRCGDLYCTVLYCTVLYCTVLYCTVLYCTVLYCTVLYR